MSFDFSQHVENRHKAKKVGVGWR